MSVWGRTKMAIKAAWRAFTDPESEVRDLSRDDRMEMYAEAWNYYRNRMFSPRDGKTWSAYLAQRELYKFIRLIYNPVPNIVDFYVDNIWQPANNGRFPNLQTPLQPQTNEKLIEAVAQLDRWGNFLTESQKIKRYTAATGNVLVEVIDDLGRQKVLHRTVWPGYVTEIELNSTGDVQNYTLEYEVFDRELKESYIFRKVVTKETFSYFRDDRPFVPDGQTSEVEANPYGFCPAVWIRHTDDGGDFGLPACLHFDKIDEINSLASHLHDNIHKNIESPKVISTEGDILPIIGANKTSDGRLTTQDPRLNWVVFKAGKGASVSDLAGSIDLADSHPYLSDLIKSLEDDYPELQAAAMIRENSQLSGAALERMLTPAQNRLDSFQAGYNDQLIKLRQMQLAIAGFRANGNGWGSLSSQQQAFKPFSLSSYEKGDLDLSMRPATLVGETEAEREELLLKKASRATTLTGIVDPYEQLVIAGYGEDEIEEIQKRQAAENEIITDPEEEAEETNNDEN